MLKGDYEFINTPLGVVAFVGLVIALIVFVQVTFAKFSAEMMVTESQIQAVDAAHLVEDCMMKEGGSSPIYEGTIRKGFLDSKRGKDLADICGIKASIGARVECLECQDNKPYDFYYKEEGDMHSIYITVKDGENNYLSRLTVRLYSQPFTILPS